MGSLQSIDQYFTILRSICKIYLTNTLGNHSGRGAHPETMGQRKPVCKLLFGTVGPVLGLCAEVLLGWYVRSPDPWGLWNFSIHYQILSWEIG